MKIDKSCLAINAQIVMQKIVALLCFIPFCLLAAPVVIYIDWRLGRGHESARIAERRALDANWAMQPFKWAHRVLCCSGRPALQRW